jgi:hypothetical protein
MRLWTLHPKYLDAKGLVALWRETLLAQKVLTGRTQGYRQHPQLKRFRACVDPRGAIAVYLRYIRDEARQRGYRFDARKIGRRRFGGILHATSGQLAYERRHLCRKLFARARDRYYVLVKLRRFDPHPLFRVRRGPIASWEVVP